MEGLRVKVPNRIRVEIRWRTITASDEADWPFRKDGKLGPIFCDQTRRGAQIYRFLFHDEKFPSCYIGQSECFEKRNRKYLRSLKLMRSGRPASDSTVESYSFAFKQLNSDSKTRVGARIQIAELHGTKVELQLMDFDEFAFNKIEISPSLLTSPFRRMAMENLAILEAEVSGLRILNRGTDTQAKAFTDLLWTTRK